MCSYVLICAHMNFCAHMRSYVLIYAYAHFCLVSVRVRMPIEGTGFLSGGQMQTIEGRITDEWVNLSAVQVWKVVWSDGDDGELELPALCMYATMWDKHQRSGASACTPNM